MATQQDAQLVVQLYQWGATIGFDDALRTVFSKDFDPETAPMDEPAFGTILTFGETLATFVKHGLLDGELVRDLLWVEGIWARVSHHALAARAEANEPRLYENFEALATMAAV